ncbi:MAG: rhamnulokinase [Opitutus sp.]|nr:rhamnulokinase [Opitutus sp.]
MQTPVHCAAVDLGATSGRVIVGTWSKQRLELTEVHRFPNQFRSLGAHDYWDLPYLWDEVRAGLVKARAQFPRIASVGVDSWGVDYVLTNDAGRPVFPVHAYRDARTQAGLAKLKNTRAALARIYAATGIPAVFYNSSLQLAETIESCPAVADLATHCLFLPDYFNFLLSGEMNNGHSIAGTTQLLDVHRPAWSRAALDYFRVPPTWLTPPVPTGQKLGRVRGIAGFEETTVIAVPGHDTTCAYDAMPAAPDGTDIFLSSGTWSLVGFESAQPLLGTGALAARVANDQTGRGDYRPLVNVIGLWLLESTLKDFASRPTNDRQWAALIRVAESLPLPARLLDVTDPAFGNPPSMKKAIDAQLKKARARPPRDLAGYVRLICESLGRGHAEVIQTFERLSGRRFQRILMVGGGSKNRLLCQATANASGLPVMSFALEGSATGNVASQLIALRAVRDLATFRACLTKQLAATTYQPRS